MVRGANGALLIAGSATTSPSRSAPTPGCRPRRGRFSSTPVTACPTFRRPRKPIYFLPSRAGVRSPLFPWWYHADPPLDLVTFCENEKVPFQTFDDFSDIHNTVKNIVAGKLSVTEAATGRK